ncbi:uncharacterized protein Triagg1_6709 [Trichoderma aggressivum f. europaeum]|uniref:Protein FAF1 n=1 Tax=Trichoderma aggressivum f. europaeum TaxID=173218 RepID=A0AAE1LZ92_9HYPO|nr:hypothetical protein Triagg1_6709 [Trichoderma aggressivum f. europaeum]
MAVLGKRKAPEPTASTEDAQEIFRRHFEAQFLPLPEAKRKAKAVEEEDGSEDDGDASGSEGGEWDGLSSEDDDEDEDGVEDDEDDEEDEDEDDAPVIEVVDHSVSQAPTTSTMSKRELKAFMSSRPPDQTSPPRPTAQPSSSSKPSAALPEDAPSLLAQDLELRRLIAESHLLQTNKPLSLAAALSTTSSPNAQPKAFSSGRVRQKALDMRIQALGSKTSILKQEKMPMHMRKGINAAAVEREAKRRREAKETGVILERETGKKKRRERKSGGGGGFGPAVGRLKGAELRISERDVKKIEGTRDTFGRRGGKR